LGEFQELLRSDSTKEQKEEELGDLFFALINYARLSGLNPENALSRTNDKFIRRFQGVEKALDSEGISLVDATLEQMDAHWDQIKQSEKNG
jgi:uncharacterized protein YabN with tetrapyrrole methylase and pyrophosphatase domain